MEKTGKVVVWLSILSTFCMGCYSSVLIEPTKAEKEGMYTERIEYVVTNDWTKYEFVEPPDVSNDTIVGRRWTSFWSKEEVSIPLSDVAEVSVYRFSTLKTLTFVGVIGATIAITYAIMVDNFRRNFMK